jgi:hypothetical protein
MSNEPPSIYWNKTTGKNEVVVPFMSKEIMTELFKELQHPRISKDEAVAKIWLSALDEKEKIIVAVNIGEFKERTKKSRWVYLKCMRVVKWIKSYKSNEHK